jgi:TetR/AcrR family transcriptional regulator, transcriptional repressor for nem operon
MTAQTTSDAILAAARSLIISGGYNGFSYADIADTVGLRKASIHHHFPSKLDLVRILVELYRKDAETGLTQLLEVVPSPIDAISAFTDRWAQCIEDSSIPFCVCALLASEVPALPAEVAAEVRAYFRYLSSWLTEAMERGAADGSLTLSEPASVEAEIFMATVHGAMLSARAQHDVALFRTIMAPTLNRLRA